MTPNRLSNNLSLIDEVTGVHISMPAECLSAQIEQQAEDVGHISANELESESDTQSEGSNVGDLQE